MIPNEPDFLNFQKIGNMELQGEYGFPKIKGIKLKHPENVELIGFNYATNKKTQDKEKLWVHFFLPDYRFQQVWNNPQNYIECFQQYKGICSPDFSCYVGMPKAMQIFNVYRMAFLTAYYQRYGIHVLPSVTWGEPDTYDWCFSWIPKGSAVVCSTVGCMQNKESTMLFLKGYEEMVSRIEPSEVIIYGKAIPEMRPITPEFHRVPSMMEMRRETALWKQPKNWGKIAEAPQQRLEDKHGR